MATRTIKLLKPGTFTDIRGTKVTFTKADLEGVAASYDAQSDPAPLVIGHPKIDAPAYGWVGALAMEGDHLVATPSKIAAAFGEAVDAGHYAKVSAQLYPPAHPSNPKPGAWYLQHVGFLGAAAPGVKGLGTVAFSEADDAAAVTVITDPEQTMTDEVQSAAFAEREGALAEREAAIAAREAEADRRERDGRHNENVAFAEGLVTAGTLAPHAKDRVVAIMDELAPLAVVSFGEGDDAKGTPLELFKALFDKAQPIVSLGEAAPADPKGGASVTVVSFAAPPGYAVVGDNAELHARASRIMAENPGMKFWDAFSQARLEPAA